MTASSWAKGDGPAVTGAIEDDERLLNEIFFCPLPEKFCLLFKTFPSWGPGCPDGSSFCPLSSSDQEKGCFGVRLEVFVYVHINS